VKKELQQGLVTRNSGYRYRDNHGVDMVEYHVDSSKLSQDETDKETQFGGNLSLCIEMDKPLIIFGHEDSIFEKYHMKKSVRVAPYGTTFLLPKDDGQGLMISLLHCYSPGSISSSSDLLVSVAFGCRDMKKPSTWGYQTQQFLRV
jgi:hypothetical protein